MSKRLETKAIFDEWYKKITGPRYIKMLGIFNEIADGKNPTLPDFGTTLDDTIAIAMEVPIMKAFSLLERRLNVLEKRIAALEPIERKEPTKRSKRKNNNRQPRRTK